MTRRQSHISRLSVATSVQKSSRMRMGLLVLSVQGKGKLLLGSSYGLGVPLGR